MAKPQIRTNESGWSEVVDPSGAIAKWEQDTGRTVPNDYKSFMRKYNGGRPWPREFKHLTYAYPDDSSGFTYLEPLYDWEYVLEVWNGKYAHFGMPSNMLAIGADPGLIEVLLSVDPATHGQISAWPRTYDEPQLGSTYIHLAPDFRTFITSLVDESGTDFADWDLPGLRDRNRLLEF